MIYIYDGSFEGLLTCVFESFSQREMPDDIVAQSGAVQLSLFSQKTVDTDQNKARRVQCGIEKKLTREALYLIMHAFLSHADEKEKLILKFVHLGMRQGKSIIHKISHPTVSALIKLQRNVRNEAHLLKEFIRFSDYDGVLIAKISPKNIVLPLLAEHFTVRLRNEQFLILDNTHEMALTYADGETNIIEAQGLSWADPGQEEKSFRSLWKLYYDTIAVEGRENPDLRMSQMPKRYWANMTEFLQIDAK